MHTVIILIKTMGALQFKTSNDTLGQVRHFDVLKPIFVAFGHLFLKKTKMEGAFIREGAFI